MEVEAALRVGVLRLLRLVALVARMQVALEHVLAVSDRVRVDGPRLHQARREALHRARRAELVAATREHDVVEPAAGQERGGDRQAEADGQRHGLGVLVVLRHDLPHVRAGRDLEGPDVPPPEVHAVVADVATVPEPVADDDAVARADRDLGLEVGVADRQDPLVHLDALRDDVLLAGRLTLRDDLARDRVRERLRQLPRTFGAVLPAEEAVDDVHVREEIRDGPHVRVPPHVVEQDRVAAVEVLLKPGQLEIPGDRNVRLHEQPLAAQPLDRRGQRTQRLFWRARTLRVAQLGLPLRPRISLRRCHVVLL